MNRRLSFFLASVITLTVVLTSLQNAFSILAVSQIVAFWNDAYALDQYDIDGHIFLSAALAFVLAVFHLWPLVFPRSAWKSALASLVVLVPVLFIDSSDVEVWVAASYAGLWLAVITTYWTRAIFHKETLRVAVLLGLVSFGSLMASFYGTILGIFAVQLAGISVLWLIVLTLKRYSSGKKMVARSPQSGR